MTSAPAMYAAAVTGFFGEGSRQPLGRLVM